MWQTEALFRVDSKLVRWEMEDWRDGGTLHCGKHIFYSKHRTKCIETKNQVSHKSVLQWEVYLTWSCLQRLFTPEEMDTDCMLWVSASKCFFSIDGHCRVCTVVVVWKRDRIMKSLTVASLTHTSKPHYQIRAQTYCIQWNCPSCMRVHLRIRSIIMASLWLWWRWAELWH